MAETPEHIRRRRRELRFRFAAECRIERRRASQRFSQRQPPSPIRASALDRHGTCNRQQAFAVIFADGVTHPPATSDLQLLSDNFRPWPSLVTALTLSKPIASGSYATNMASDFSIASLRRASSSIAPTIRSDTYEHLAGRFAAKEAVLKVLGTGWRGKIAWTDIEITRDPSGQPAVCLGGECAEIADRIGINRWHVSISHIPTHATASAIGANER